jgi:transposase
MHKLAIRARVIIHHETACSSVREIAALFGVSKSTVARWMQRGLDDLIAKKPRGVEAKRCLIYPHWCAALWEQTHT